jgi:hypothetical protein
MDVSAAASSSTAASVANLQQDASVAVLKKSMDAEQSVALQLIQAIQAPQPAHLGSMVDLLA